MTRLPRSLRTCFDGRGIYYMSRVAAVGRDLSHVRKVDPAAAAVATGVTVALALAITRTRTLLPPIPPPPRFPAPFSLETRGVALDGGKRPVEVARGCRRLARALPRLLQQQVAQCGPAVCQASHGRN